MTPEETYEIWVPPGGMWSLWARPVLFAQMPPDPGAPVPSSGAVHTSWAPTPRERALLVIDLPGAESVQMALALAGCGYRPVPAYNACTDLREVIDQGPIVRALRHGALHLRSLDLPAYAPPAFLLDADRARPLRPIRPGDFDNRWQVFPQDFPSARFLMGQGITRVILLQRGSLHPRDDLADVLRGWQDAGIPVWAKDLLDAAPPAPIRVGRLPWYRALWHGVLAILGLRRSPRGGFGSRVPEPSQG